jgi:hypothetical protein
MVPHYIKRSGAGSRSSGLQNNFHTEDDKCLKKYFDAFYPNTWQKEQKKQLMFIDNIFHALYGAAILHTPRPLFHE